MNMVGLISMALLRTGARRAGDQTDDLIHVCSLNYRQAGKRRLPGEGRTGGCTTGRLRRYLVFGAGSREEPDWTLLGHSASRWEGLFLPLKALLTAQQINETDRNDARGTAQMMPSYSPSTISPATRTLTLSAFPGR